MGKIKDLFNEAIKQPKDVKNVWDNGGKTVDRYTIILDPKQGWDEGDSLGVDDEGGKSFSQFDSGTKEGSNLGKKIKWDKLPEITQKHIVKRLKES